MSFPPPWGGETIPYKGDTSYVNPVILIVAE